MLIEEFDVAVVDTLGNILADLMRRAALDHVQAGPPILSLGTGGGADEEIVFQFTLESISLDMVGQCSWNFSSGRAKSTMLGGTVMGIEKYGVIYFIWMIVYSLGISNTGEA